MLSDLRQIPGVALACSVLFLLALPSASDSGWEEFLADVRTEATAAGVSQQTLDAAFGGLEPIARVIELDRHQPESTLTFDEYMASRVPESLIERAGEKYAEHQPLLEAIAAHYGFDAYYIVAIWAVETRFGSYTGGFDVIAALATLAFDGRRSAFFRNELLHALTILDEGHISRTDMTGSWAGAMGQSQFMPSSFNRFAVDWDLDRRRDIWQNQGDVFASIANYLARSGWQRSMPWGAAVALPEEFDLTRDGVEPLETWLSWGVMWQGEGPVLPMDAAASLVLPAGANGPAFLVFDNYRAILKWNRSDYFAMSVTAIADALSR